MVDASVDFAVRLHKGTLYSQVQDENGTLYTVANIGGGHVLTKAEYLMKEQRRHEAAEFYARRASLRTEILKRSDARQKAEEQKSRLRQQEQEEFRTKAKYALTGEDIQRMLPVSPVVSYYSRAHTAPDVLQVYVLMNHELDIHICAVISKRCNWLKFNDAGCCDYSFDSGPCSITNRFTAIDEQSQIGIRLLSARSEGEVITVGQNHYLLVNIGGGDFALYHADWHMEKHEIERRNAIRQKGSRKAKTRTRRQIEQA